MNFSRGCVLCMTRLSSLCNKYHRNMFVKIKLVSVCLMLLFSSLSFSFFFFFLQYPSFFHPFVKLYRSLWQSSWEHCLLHAVTVRHLHIYCKIIVFQGKKYKNGWRGGRHGSIRDCMFWTCMDGISSCKNPDSGMMGMALVSLSVPLILVCTDSNKLESLLYDKEAYLEGPPILKIIVCILWQKERKKKK